MSVYSDNIIEQITEQILEYKKINGHPNHIDAVVEFVKEKYYDFLTLDTINDFINSGLKQKLLIDASNLNLIEKEHEHKTNNLLF